MKSLSALHWALLWSRRTTRIHQPAYWRYRAVEINIDMKNAGLDFYHHLARRKLTWSLRDYSSHYLGMAENYACLRGDRGPSERALINLFRRLWEERRFLLCIRVARLILFARQER